VTAPSSPIATTPSGGTLNGGEPDWEGLADEDGTAELAGRGSPLLPDALGEMLASITVVPDGDCDAPGVTEPPGAGVPGTVVGRGVGRGVGPVVGDGLAVEVGAVTTMGPTETGAGFAPLALIAVNVAVQLPSGRVVEPAQVPCCGLPLLSDRGTDLLATEAVTLVAVVTLLWNWTESRKTVAVVPIIGVAVGFCSAVDGGAPSAGFVRATSAVIATTNQSQRPGRGLINPCSAARRRFAESK
jgi:hypothetical protein